jgi:hypothetical protein
MGRDDTSAGGSDDPISTETIDSTGKEMSTSGEIEASAPDTPAGYAQPVRYEYGHTPYNPYALDIALFGFAVALFFLFGQTVGDPAVLFEPTSYPVSLTVGATVVTFVIHEAIHAILGRLIGCDVSIGLRGASLWTSLSNAFQSRMQTVLIALGPTAVITPVYTAMLIYGSPALAAAALVGLFVNTVGLRHDLTLVYRMWELPPGALLYNSVEHSFVFEPSDSES